jgi:hypothetical protein
LLQDLSDCENLVRSPGLSKRSTPHISTSQQKRQKHNFSPKIDSSDYLKKLKKEEDVNSSSEDPMEVKSLFE